MIAGTQTSFSERLKRLSGESNEPVQVIKITNELRDYIPAYPLTNKLKFFDCWICGKQEKKMFRLNLKSFEASKDILNRMENTLQKRTHVIYLCLFHFDANFGRFKEMIEDFHNDNLDKYETIKN
jgi:hypothetical protein